MKITSALTLALAAATAQIGAQAAPSVSTSLPAGELTTLRSIRKSVWVDWFAGDTTALHRVLGPELVAMNPGEAHWQTLNESLAGSAGFRSEGGKLVSVSFGSEMTHRFGDVVVMFSRYEILTQIGGARSTQRGRATEVFVRSNGRWVHTSWHLDREP